MEPIIKETFVSFKVFEQKMFDFVCKLAREATKKMLETYDKELAEERDKACYRNKGTRSTSIKTIYGTVSYRRRVYQKRQENGQNEYVYLLDERMGTEKIGLFSANLAEAAVRAATESSYRVAAEQISRISGQDISHGGIWDLVQKRGERICQEEEALVGQMETGQAKGTKILSVLFEEMDGVWLSMQDKNHQKMKKQEMKVATMYEGWTTDRNGQSHLAGKLVLAGMENSKKFHAKREALLENRYAACEIQQRVLNGDGRSWIREEYDPDTIFQLDRYHVYQEILQKIREKTVQKELRRKYEEEKPELHLTDYADETSEDEERDKRGQPPGKSPVSKREPGVRGNDSEVCRWNRSKQWANRSLGDTKCREGSKERRERKRLCGEDKRSYSFVRRHTNSRQESAESSAPGLKRRCAG